MIEEWSLLENLHFTNLKKQEGYFEIKRWNYRVPTPGDYVKELIDDIEAVSIEWEIQH